MLDASRPMTMFRHAMRSFALLCCVVSAAAGPSPTAEQIFDYFQQTLSPRSEVYLPNQANYSTELTPRWNTLEHPMYIIGVKPALDVDVQAIVGQSPFSVRITRDQCGKQIKYASEHGIPFLGTGGGHGYTTTLSLLQNGIDIDLGFFNSVDVDISSDTMTIGGSVIFDDIFDPLYSAGKEIQTGYCSCVGMVGATLGGGVGPLQGIHGLIVDSLKSVTIITGTAEIINASATENCDLFWGIRGAGMNFGIVTSATYQIHPQTNEGQGLSADLLFSAAQNASVFEVLRSYSDNQPDGFTITSAIQWSTVYEEAVIMVSTIYWGPEDEGMKLNQPFLNAQPIVQNITMLPWNQLLKQNRFGADAPGCMKGNIHSVYGLNLYSLDVYTYVDVFGSFSEFFSANSDLRVSFFVTEMHPRRVSMQTPADETAFPYRNATAYTFVDFMLPDASFESTTSAFGQSIRNKLGAASGNPRLETYVNYAHGDEGPLAWYTEDKLTQLRILKERWDPGAVFNFTNGIAI